MRRKERRNRRSILRRDVGAVTCQNGKSVVSSPCICIFISYHFNSAYQQYTGTQESDSNYQELGKVPLRCQHSLQLVDRRLTGPDAISIILDGPIGTESSHGKCSLDGSFIPFIMISTPEIVDESLSLNVRSKVVRHLSSAKVLDEVGNSPNSDHVHIQS
jgi:hypothetical protein